MADTGRFQSALQEFMRGRNGTDDLYKFLFWVYAALLVLNLGLRIQYLDFLQWVIIAALFFRMLSKNLDKRRAENAAYLAARDKLVRKLGLGRARYRSAPNPPPDDDHILRVCPVCSTTLRLPRRTGRHGVRCPKCGEVFEVESD